MGRRMPCVRGLLDEVAFLSATGPFDIVGSETIDTYIDIQSAIDLDRIN